MKVIHAALAGWTSRGQTPLHVRAACEEQGERCGEGLQGPGAARDGMQTFLASLRVPLAAGGNVFVFSAGEKHKGCEALQLPPSRSDSRCYLWRHQNI